VIFEYDIENEDGTVFDTLDCKATFIGAKGEAPEVDDLIVKVGNRVLRAEEVDLFFGEGTYENIRQYALDHVDPVKEAAL
jgi:hypothetical protein